jgi:hypothetical protein
MLLSVFFFGVTEFGAPYQYRAHSRRRAAVRDHMALRRSRLTHRVTSHTSSLRTRGDQFDKAFVVEAAGGGHTFGSFECAIQAIAPITSMAIASETTCNELSGEVDQIICATTPRPFFAVGTSTATLHRYGPDRISSVTLDGRRCLLRWREAAKWGVGVSSDHNILKTL